MKNLKGISISLLIIVVIFSLISKYFFTANNIINILQQTSIIAITGFGMTYALMIGGIDLSVGSIIALSGMVFAMILKSTDNVLLAVFFSLLSGFFVGGVNGVIVAKLKIPSFIVTVSTMGIFRGIAYSFTDSKPIPIENESALFIGNGKILGLPLAVIVVIFTLVITSIVLEKTKFGRQAKLLGGNLEAAKYIGINISKIEIFVFVIVGTTAAISGVLLSSRLYSAQPNAAIGYELDAIAAAVLGGTSLSGGFGSVFGTFIGAFIIGIINNGMNLMKIPYFFQLIIKGIIIIIAVYIDKRNKEKVK